VGRAARMAHENFTGTRLLNHETWRKQTTLEPKHRWINDIKIHIKRHGVRVWTGFRWLKMGDAMWPVMYIRNHSLDKMV